MARNIIRKKYCMTSWRRRWRRVVRGQMCAFIMMRMSRGEPCLFIVSTWDSLLVHGLLMWGQIKIPFLLPFFTFLKRSSLTFWFSFSFSWLSTRLILFLSFRQTAILSIFRLFWWSVTQDWLSSLRSDGEGRFTSWITFTPVNVFIQGEIWWL